MWTGASQRQMKNGQPVSLLTIRANIQDTRIVYVNDAGGFRPATASEIQSVEQYLQKHGQ